VKRVTVLLGGLLCSLSLLFSAPDPALARLLTAEERTFLDGHPTVTVLMDFAKAPIEYIDAKTSMPKGVSAGYLVELSALTGIEFEIVSDPVWKSSYQRFYDGTIDMAVALNRTPEREEVFLFSEPYLSMPIVLMARSQVGYIDGLEGVGDRPLAIVDGYSIAEWVKRDYPHLNTILVSSTEEGLDLVQRGKAFAQTGNLMVLNHYLAIKGMTDTLKVVGITPYTNAFSLAVQRDLAPLLGILEKALSLIDNETRIRLNHQNLPIWYDLVIPRRIQLVIIASAVALLFILLLWIVTLMRQMRRSKAVEREIEKSEHKFRLIFEDSPTPLMLIDNTGQIIDVNKSWVALFGYEKSTLTTVDKILEKVYPDSGDREKMAEEWGQFKARLDTEMQERLIPGTERVITDSNGILHTVETGGTLLHDSFLITYYDVTERNRSLSKIRELHREAEQSRLMILSALEDQQISDLSLRQSRATLEAAINSMIDAVYIIDANASFVMVNEAFYRYYRFDTRHEVPQTLYDFRGLFESFDEGGHPITSSMWVGFQALDGQSGTVEYQVHKMGTGFTWFGSYSYAPIRDGEGAVSGAVVVCRDVTEERSNRQKLRFQRDHDYLTGLLSRVHFEEMLHSMEETVPFTVGLVDINGLKLVNDTLGHEMGDEVIKRTADLLLEQKDDGVLIARYGGDEFAFLMVGKDEETAEAFIRRVEEAAKEITFSTFHLSLSSGVAHRTLLDESPADMLRRAEEMMGRAKLYESASAKSKSVSLLMNSLFAKSMRESQHSRRVSELCAFISQQLELSEREVNRMRTAGLMHDIGKIGIRETILNKPGKLDSAEWVEVKRHPEIGYRILSAVTEFSDLALAILEHHERWDGSGYPQGLKAEQISYQARIIAIADSYDAMTGPRPYRTPMAKEEAIEEIFNNRGILYDPQIVQVFVSTIGQFEPYGPLS